MANFPTLSVKPILGNFSETSEDSTIKSEFEGGYVNARSRFTRNRLTFGPIAYVNLTDADKALLDAFYLTVKCATIFNWTHARTGGVKNVRFENPLKITISKDVPNKWETSFNLVEA